MATQKELDDTYMGVAILHSRLSKAKRLKVGACLVTSTGALVPAVNGLPRALGNECEIEVDGKLVTWDAVQHAERQVINKCAIEGISTKDAKVYVNFNPCVNCASSLIACGISELIYADEYRDTTGIELLKSAGIKVRKYYS
jgi:dCMP deaminase